MKRKEYLEKYPKRTFTDKEIIKNIEGLSRTKALKLYGKEYKEIIFATIPREDPFINTISVIKPEIHIGKRFIFNKETDEYEKTQISHSRNKAIPIIKKRVFPKRLKKKDKLKEGKKFKEKRLCSLSTIKKIQRRVKHAHELVDNKYNNLLPRCNFKYKPNGELKEGLRTNWKPSQGLAKLVCIQYEDGTVAKLRRDETFNKLTKPNLIYNFISKQEYKRLTKKKVEFIDKRKNIKVKPHSIIINEEGIPTKVIYKYTTDLVEYEYYDKKDGIIKVENKESYVPLKIPIEITSKYWNKEPLILQPDENNILKARTLTSFSKRPEWAVEHNRSEESRLKRESKHHLELSKALNKAKFKKRLKSPIKRRHIKVNKSRLDSLVKYPKNNGFISDKQKEWNEKRHQKFLVRLEKKKEKKPLASIELRSQRIKEEFQRRKELLKEYKRVRGLENIKRLIKRMDVKYLETT
jgi:hypothetical protein